MEKEKEKKETDQSPESWEEEEGTPEQSATRLKLACERGNTEIVRLLLSIPDIEVNQAGLPSGVTPLWIACKHGREEIVRLLLQDPRLEVNKANLAGRTPLWIACFEGQEQVVRVLLQDPRIHLNQPDKFGFTPLWIACAQDRKRIALLLLWHPGVEVNPCNVRKETLLFSACSEGNRKIVEILVKSPRVDLNQPEKAGRSPLWISCYYGRKEIVKLLLGTGRKIDTQQRTNKGEKWWHDSTPTKPAREKGFHEIANLIEAYEQNPRGMALKLRMEMEWSTVAADIFALGTLVCDGFLGVDEEKRGTPAGRFLWMFSQLHLDLQHLLVNRSQEISENLLFAQDVQLALRHLLATIS